MNGVVRWLFQRHQVGKEIFALLITKSIEQALGHE
jgi:hypothetical protein